MRIIIDIGHPGHVHLFKNLAKELIRKNHSVLFTCREKEFEVQLLNEYGFRFISFGKHYQSKAGKIWGLFWFNLKMIKVSYRFKPDLYLSHGSIYAAQTSWLFGKPHISMEDSGNMEQIRLYKPFTKVILTPDVLDRELGSRQVRYSGYHEIAYLHEKYFHTDKEILKDIGIKDNEKFCVLRFVSWKATHDYGQKGLTKIQKIELVKILENKFRVFITSEVDLPAELESYQLKIRPSQIHNLIALAEIVISEGATVASEAGVLGTPSIYINSIIRSYNEDQEKYGTVINYRNGEQLLTKIFDLISDKDLKSKVGSNRSKLMANKINVTDFLIWFVENYPASFRIIKENSEYQYKFR